MYMQGSDSDQSCVQRMPGGMPMVLVGDVFFRRNVVRYNRIMIVIIIIMIMMMIIIII